MIDNCAVDISVEPESKEGRRNVVLDCEVKCTGHTGAEMRALTGATIAPLCVYDMCKALPHDVLIKEASLASYTLDTGENIFEGRRSGLCRD